MTNIKINFPPHLHRLSFLLHFQLLYLLPTPKQWRGIGKDGLWSVHSILLAAPSSSCISLPPKWVLPMGYSSFREEKKTKKQTKTTNQLLNGLSMANIPSGHVLLLWPGVLPRPLWAHRNLCSSAWSASSYPSSLTLVLTRLFLTFSPSLSTPCAFLKYTFPEVPPPWL